MSAEVLRPGQAISGEVITTPLDLSGAINVTPSEPTGDLSRDLSQKNHLPAWRKGLVAATALLSGLTAVGAPSPALGAEKFRALPGEILTSAECIKDDFTLDNPFSDNPDDRRPFVVYVYKEEPVIAVADTDTEEVGSLAVTAADDDGKPKDTTADAEEEDVEIALATGVTIVNAEACPLPKNPYGSKRIDIFDKIAKQPNSEIDKDVTLEDVKRSARKLLDPRWSDFLSKGELIMDGREYVRLYLDKDLLEELLGTFDPDSKAFKNFMKGIDPEYKNKALIDFRIYSARALIANVLSVAVIGQKKDQDPQALPKDLPELWDKINIVVDMTRDYAIGLKPNSREEFDRGTKEILGRHSY